MIICIGPVCIPVWGLIPFVLLYARSAWAWVSSKVFGTAPEAQQVANGDGAKKNAQQPSANEPAAASKPSASEPSASEPAVASKPAASSDGANLDTKASGLRQRSAAAVSTSEPGVSAVKSEKKWEAAVKAATKEVPLVAAFSAPWCKPCKALMPVFEELSQANGTFVVMDAEDFQELAMELGVSSLPTYKVFVDGECTGTLTMASERKLRKFVDEHTA